MLYGGAIRFLHAAEEALERRNGEAAHTALSRAQEIVFELITSLDDSAGEVAENLLALYAYLNHRLAQANVQKSVQPVQEVLRIMSQLESAWRQVLTTQPQRSKAYGSLHTVETPRINKLSA